MVYEFGIGRTKDGRIPASLMFHMGEANLKAMRTNLARLRGEPVDLPRSPVESRLPTMNLVKDLDPGLPPDDETFTKFPLAPPAERRSSKPAEPERPVGRLLSVVFERFKAQQSREEWKPDTRRHYVLAFKHFIGFFGDRPVSAYTRRDISDFKSEIAKVSAQYGQGLKYRDLSLREIVDISEMHPLEPKLSSKTINKHMTCLSSFWKWALQTARQVRTSPQAFSSGRSVIGSATNV